ncbi:serine/threonine-protein kinase [Sphaerisporangium sp. NPDC004334]
MAEPGAPEVPGYEVVGVLGQGGFGVVYRARQLAVRREVALKVDNRVLLSERDRRRFMREVSSAGALSGHPHVADVYDAGVLTDGRPYMVLELCPGGSLADRLRAEGPLSPAEVRDIGVRIGDALAAAHAAGVLHRDVKPANILVNGYGLVALTDFGLAAAAHADGDMSVTRESLTPAFGPPEAFELAAPSPAGDVYSLAATLYALLSGRPPRFPEGGVVNLAMIMAMHRRPIPEIPGVPAELTAVLRAGMATDPRLRIPSAAALRDALSALPARLLPSTGSRGAAPTGHGTSLPHSAPGERPSHSYGPGARPGPPVPGVPDGGTGPSGRPEMTGPGTRAQATGPDGRRMEATGPRGGPDGPGSRGRADASGPRGRADASVARGRDALATMPPPKQHAQTGLYLAVAGVFALLLTAGTAIMIWEGRDPGATTPSGPSGAAGTPAAASPASTGVPAGGAFGRVATTTVSCAAAAVPGANAACGREAECWGGMVVITGDVSIKRRGCEEAHTWETFAVAPLPPDGVTADLSELEKHPVVRKLCSLPVLLRSRYGAARNIAAGKWMVSALPPSPEAFKEGVRIYRCVGARLGDERPGTYFRPLS